MPPLARLASFAAWCLLVAGGSALTAPTAAAVPPSNDTIPTAKPIGAIPYVDRVDTREATRGAVGPGACGGDSHSVWYRYAPTQSRTLDLDATQSNFDAFVTVWRRTSSGVALVADNCGAALRFDLNAGSTYLIMVNECCREVGGDLVFRVRPALRVSASVAPEGTVSHASGDATVDVTVTCNRAVTVDASVNLRQRISDTLVAAGNGAVGGQACAPGSPARLSVLVLAESAPFRAGNAGVLASASACDFVCSGLQAPRQVVLLRWVR